MTRAVGGRPVSEIRKIASAAETKGALAASPL